jgi:hypothetical protein
MPSSAKAAPYRKVADGPTCLFQGIFRTAGKALATDLVPEELRASVVGWYMATVGLSALVASVVGWPTHSVWRGEATANGSATDHGAGRAFPGGAVARGRPGR